MDITNLYLNIRTLVAVDEGMALAKLLDGDISEEYELSDRILTPRELYDKLKKVFEPEKLSVSASFADAEEWWEMQGEKVQSRYVATILERKTPWSPLSPTDKHTIYVTLLEDAVKWWLDKPQDSRKKMFSITGMTLQEGQKFEGVTAKQALTLYRLYNT